MSEPASINSQIVEDLYCEALALADEVRSRFASPPSRQAEISRNPVEDLMRIARSCEGLRATTRIMHAIAWLLNQRAFLMGEISQFHLRRHARLSHELQAPDPDNLAMLEWEARELVEDVMRLYARLLRLDREWRRVQLPEPSAVETLRERIYAMSA